MWFSTMVHDEIGISFRLEGFNMTYDDAVKYCEDHECTECDVCTKDLESEQLKNVIHINHVVQI